MCVCEYEYNISTCTFIDLRLWKSYIRRTIFTISSIHKHISRMKPSSQLTTFSAIIGKNQRACQPYIFSNFNHIISAGAFGDLSGYTYSSYNSPGAYDYTNYSSYYSPESTDVSLGRKRRVLTTDNPLSELSHLFNCPPFYFIICL